MTRTLTLSAALAVLLVPSDRAEAQQFMDWGNLCMPGAFRACMSFSLSLHYQESLHQTEATITLANTQGWAGLPDPGPVGFGSFFIAGLSLGPEITSGTWAGGIPVGGDMPWWLDTYFLDLPAYSVSGEVVYAAAPQQGQNLLYGCDLPPDLPPVLSDPFWHPQTCEQARSYTSVFAGRVELTTDTRVTINARTWDGAGSIGASYQCTSGVDCLNVMVAPEPSTWIMVATGLLGLGLVARRRREQEDTDSLEA